MDDQTESRAPLPALIVLFIGAAIITVGMVFLTYGLYALIRTGTWPPYPLSRMLAEVGITLSPGGEGPIAWLVSQSACVTLLSAGTMIAAFAVWLIARAGKRRAAAEAGAAA